MTATAPHFRKLFFVMTATRKKIKQQPADTSAKLSLTKADIEQMEKDEAAGKSRKATPNPIDEIELVENARSIPVSEIDPSPYQTREVDDDFVEELTDSIKQDGQLVTGRVRFLESGRFQLISGHTRYLACKRLKKPFIADVIRCSEATAARQVQGANLQRELNPIERARGLQAAWKAYEAAGESQRTLAKDLGIDQGTISNLIRLLAAPESLQARLMSGDISQPQLRTLSRWSDHSGIITRFLSELAKRDSGSGPIRMGDWNTCLTTAIFANSRSTKPSIFGARGDPNAPLFKVKDYESELDIQEVTNGPLGKEQRAFNVERWNQLQAEAKKAIAEKEAKKNAAKPAEAKADKTEKRTDPTHWNFKRPLRTCWLEHFMKCLGKRFAEPITKAELAQLGRMITAILTPDDLDFTRFLKMTAVEWEAFTLQMYRDTFEESEGGIPYHIDEDAVLSLADRFTPQAGATWKPTVELLKATAAADLRDFAEEFEVIPFAPGLEKELAEKWREGYVPKIYCVGEPNQTDQGND